MKAWIPSIISVGILVLGVTAVFVPTAQALPNQGMMCQDAPNDNLELCLPLGGGEACMDELMAQHEAANPEGELFIGVCASEGGGGTVVCVTDPNFPNAGGLWCIPGSDDGSNTCLVYHINLNEAGDGYDKWCEQSVPVSVAGILASVQPFVDLVVAVVFFVVGTALVAVATVVDILLCAASNPVLSCI
jgi:hypothetical protein